MATLSFGEQKFWEILDRSKLTDKQIDKVITDYCYSYTLLQKQFDTENDYYSPHIGILLNLLMYSSKLQPNAKINVYSSLTEKDVEKSMPRELELWTDQYLILSGDIEKTQQLNNLIHHPNVLNTYLAQLRQGHFYPFYSQINKEFYKNIHQKLYEHSMCTPDELQTIITGIERHPEHISQIEQKQKLIRREFSFLPSPNPLHQKKYTMWFGVTTVALQFGILKENLLGQQAISHDFETYANFIYEKARKGHSILLTHQIDHTPNQRPLTFEELQNIHQIYTARHYDVVLAFRNIPDPFDYQPGIERILQ